MASSSPAGRLFLVSVGSSILNLAEESPSGQGLRERAKRLGDDFPQAPTPGVARHEPSADQEALEARLFESLQPEAGVEGRSAELDTLMLMENPVSTRDEVHLVVPQTFEAIVAARVLGRYLEEEISADTRLHLIRGLQVGTPEQLEAQGLPNLVITASRIIEQAEDRPVRIAATAGFKPVTIFLTLVGLIHETPVYYYAQGKSPPFEIPGIQLTLNTDLWKKYYRVFSSFRRSDEVSAKWMGRWFDGSCPSEMEPFLIEEDQEVRLSAMGNLLQRRAETVYRDPLTGACNRKFFDQLFAEPNALTRKHESIAFALLDVDHFKEVNDTYGHDVGDTLLRELVREVTSVVEEGRRSRYLIRYGGEEFLVVLPDHTTRQARDVARKILECARNLSVETNGQAITRTMTIGIASWPDEGEDVTDVIKAADDRLYEGKQAGRNRIVAP
jgi:diguanylate cyclase (GGDEF)-like protein/putative CRISPR-associated protein (TIGR02619 family)